LLPLFFEHAVVIKVEELPAVVDHAAQRAFEPEAELFVQRDRGWVVAVNADEALLIAQLFEIIFEDDEDGFGRVAALPVLARDAQAVAEDSVAVVALVCDYLPDGCAG
jgi:hypothetical protein